MRLKSSRRALVAETAHARLATPAQLQLLRAGSTAHGTRCAWRRVLRARPTSDERTQRDGARTLRHESCRCRATPLSVLGSAQLRLLSCIADFDCSLHPARPNTISFASGVKNADGYLVALQEIACIATAQPGPRRCNLRLGCIADIPAALQRRNAPETWLTPCVALADLTEALVQCKVIFCNIHTSWLQGLVSVARGPAALGWPQAACLIDLPVRHACPVLLAAPAQPSGP